MEFKLPTETVELPSKGILYPETSPLRKGTVEMKYMTAKEEDILSNQSYIQKGIVLDKLLQSLIVTPINYNELLVGDKNGLMVAARILGYGAEYTFKYKNEDQTVNLSEIDAKPLHEVVEKSSTNEFDFVLPNAQLPITFSLITQKHESSISQELEGLKKLSPNSSPPELTTRLKHIITSVNEEREKKTIREFVDNYLLAADSRALRNYIIEITPDVDLTFFPDPNGEKVDIPIGVRFFWPDI